MYKLIYLCWLCSDRFLFSSDTFYFRFFRFKYVATRALFDLDLAWHQCMSKALFKICPRTSTFCSSSHFKAISAVSKCQKRFQNITLLPSISMTPAVVRNPALSQFAQPRIKGQDWASTTACIAALSLADVRPEAWLPCFAAFALFFWRSAMHRTKVQSSLVGIPLCR